MTTSARIPLARRLAAALAVCLVGMVPSEVVAQPADVSAEAAEYRGLLDQYCVTCHNARLRTAGIALDQADLADVSDDPRLWEAVVRKMRVGAMPPSPRPRPDKPTYDGFRRWLEDELDRAARLEPNPGRTEVFHRLNQTEYRNVIRDLLALEVDVDELLPSDGPDQHGFDNAGTLSFSPVLMERYISAAHKISQLAIGQPPRGAVIARYDVPLNLIQETQLSEDLPFGSAGGAAIRHTFPVDGEYQIKVYLQTNYVDYIRGFEIPHDLEVSLDGELLERFTIGGDAPGLPAPYSFAGNIRGDDEWEAFMMRIKDEGLDIRVPVRAGPRVVGATFPSERWVPEGVLQPRLFGFSLAVNEMPDANPRVRSIEITGPLSVAGPGETPSRRQIFSCHPDRSVEPTTCAREILSRLARRAYRRPVTEADVATLRAFYDAGAEDGGFESGIQHALERLLASPDFLLRIERDPVDLDPAAVYALSDLELATRLSFFLWSSIPDDELLDLAESGQLTQPDVLEQQVRRMVADPRGHALIESFVGQWLYLRNLDAVYPTPDIFPEFDENLRLAFRQETEFFFADQLRRDRSVLELLSADYTFVNERLARHYGIRGVSGNRFRRVQMDSTHRVGLLGHGGLMTVTSYPNRTSPVLRGKFILENFLGSPPPEPPPNVPTLEERADDGRVLTMREAMERHRENPVCSSCHATMDPLGFALENFDAIGGWRQTYEGTTIDNSGVLPDGRRFAGPAGLRDLLLDQPELFVGTVTEKLLTYALGRGLEHYDMPTVRRIVHTASAHDYRWSSIILGIIESTPFQMRRSVS